MRTKCLCINVKCLNQWFSNWGRDPVQVVCLFCRVPRASDKNIHNFLYILYFVYGTTFC